MSFYAFSSLLIRIALMTPSMPGLLVTRAGPRAVSISAPFVMTPLRL